MISRALVRKFVFAISAGALLLSVSGCSEVAGSGELVSIPNVTFTCNSANCTGVGAPNSEYRVVYAEFGCTGAGDQNFYAKAVSTSLSLNCNGASCSGSASSWIDEHGLTTTQIPANSYYVCVVVFRQGSITTGPTAGDAYSYQGPFSVDANTGTIPIAGFSDGAAPAPQF